MRWTGVSPRGLSPSHRAVASPFQSKNLTETQVNSWGLSTTYQAHGLEVEANASGSVSPLILIARLKRPLQTFKSRAGSQSQMTFKTPGYFCPSFVCTIGASILPSLAKQNVVFIEKFILERAWFTDADQLVAGIATENVILVHDFPTNTLAPVDHGAKKKKELVSNSRAVHCVGRLAQPRDWLICCWSACYSLSRAAAMITQLLGFVKAPSNSLKVGETASFLSASICESKIDLYSCSYR